MSCPKFRDEEMTKEDKLITKHIRESMDAYYTDEIFRFLSTGRIGKNSKSNKEWENWAETMLNSSLKDITLADAEYLAMKTRQLKSAVEDGSILRLDGSNAKQMAVRFMTLPADLAKAHGIDRHHEAISVAAADRELQINSINTSIDILEKAFNNLSRASSNEGSKILEEHATKIELANAELGRLKALKKKGKAVTAGEIVSAKNKVTAAIVARDAVTSGKNANKSAELISLIAKTLQGDITEKQLLGIVGGDIKFESVKTLIENTRSLLDNLGNILEDSSKSMYNMIRLDLEQTFPKEEAAKLAADLTMFEKEEAYYPRKNLVNMMYKVKNIMETRKLANDVNAKDNIRELARKASTAHTKRRKTFDTEGIDLNVFPVLRQYSKEVYDHAFAAKVGYASQKFISDLFSLKSIAGQDNRGKEVMYANSVKKVIQAQMNQIFDRRASTWADEAMGALTAFQVLTKLTAPSTAVTNRFEGILQYISYNGVQNYKRAKDLAKVYEVQINEAMSGAGIDFDSRTGFDPLKRITDLKKLSTILTKEDLADMGMTNTLEITEKLSNARGGMSWLSNKIFSVTGWTRAENANRREAFEISAAEAVHYIEGRWRSKFMIGKHTDFLVDHFNLDKDLAKKAAEKGASKETRMELYRQFRNKYVIRQAYRGMFQSQFQYAESSRNFTDLDPRTSWITMFQHYPRSLASVVGWAMRDVKGLYDVGGIKALGRRRTGKLFGKEPGKFEMNDSLQHVLTLTSMSALKAALRGLTGWQITNALASPASMMLGDLLQYFLDDDDIQKGEKSYDYLFGRKQPIRQITGPVVSDVLDTTSWMMQQLGVVSMATTMSGINDGSMHQHVATTLGLMGLKPTEESLTDHGRKQYNTAFDVLREHTLYSFAIKTRGSALLSSLIQQDTDKIGQNAAAMFGIRKDWKSVKKLSDKRKAEGHPDATEILKRNMRVAQEKYFDN